jgi:hypothetical protein
MGDVLGLGITHYPPLSGRNEDMANILKGRLADPGVPSHAKNPGNWPPTMRQEWGDDDGVAGAMRHRDSVLRGIREVRKALDEFDPDFVIVWGDDQYENFKENIIPPFCVLAYDDLEVYPSAPSPRRVYQLGAAVARICQESPWRVALIASSSWSHAFLNEETYRMQPNVEFDRKMFAELRSGNLTAFRNLDLSTLEATGNQEMLDWCALAGAMAELGNRCVWAEMAETYVFNSSKVSAIFAPGSKC